MIDPNVKILVAEARKDTEIQSIVIRWRKRPDDSLFTKAKTRRERVQIVEAFYRPLKKSLLQILRLQAQVHVQDFPGSGQLILTAPVHSLRPLIETGGSLDREQGVDVLANVPVHALDEVEPPQG